MSSFSARYIAALAIGFASRGERMPARADSGPVFVVPSRPGVPIAINGRDASWSVVEGDIGLARPGHLTPVIIGGGRPLPPRTVVRSQSVLPALWTSAGARSRRNRSGSGPTDAGAGGELLAALVDRPPKPQPPRYSETPRQRPQQVQGESEHLPATIDDGQPPFAPPIVVAPYRGTQTIDHMPARPPRANTKQDAEVPRGSFMSRRIAYCFAIAACATFVVPASADRECFDNSCRMPEVIETPELRAQAMEQPVITDATQTAAPHAAAVPAMAAAPVPVQAAAPLPPPAPIRPQMVVDRLPPPALKPVAVRAARAVRQAKRPPTRERCAGA